MVMMMLVTTAIMMIIIMMMSLATVVMVMVTMSFKRFIDVVDAMITNITIMNVMFAISDSASDGGDDYLC